MGNDDGRADALRRGGAGERNADAESSRTGNATALKLPLHVDSARLWDIRDADDTAVGTCRMPVTLHDRDAPAEIVRRVNAHDELVAALREIAVGCMGLRPGHVDYGKNRTKAEIEAIALAALAKLGEPT